MKTLILIVLLVTSATAFSKTRELIFNQDVFKCGQNFTTLYSLENAQQIYLATGSEQYIHKNINASLNALIEDLKIISPARAAFLKEISDNNNRNVQKRSDIQIMRSTPASNLILPEGCLIESIASIKATLKGYAITINSRIYDSLSVSEQLYFWLNLSLDLENALVVQSQAFFENDDYKINMVQGREFMACWMDLGCRPKNVSEMHKLALNKIYSLPFMEQDKILIPINYNKYSFYESGLIRSAKDIVYPGLNEKFNSNFIFQGETYYLSPSMEPRDDLFIKFNSLGRIMCAPYGESDIDVGVGVKGPIIKDFKGKKVHWEYSIDTLGHLNFPLCWNDQYQITQGGFNLKPTEKFEVKLTSGIINLNTHMQGSGSYHSVGVTLHENEALEWVSRAIGEIELLGQKISIEGPIKFFANGKPQCVQFSKSVNLKLSGGKTLAINLKPGLRSDLHCFKADGSLDKVYGQYELFKLMQLDIEKF